jgi:hypothetical protein
MVVIYTLKSAGVTSLALYPVKNKKLVWHCTQHMEMLADAQRFFGLVTDMNKIAWQPNSCCWQICTAEALT